MHILTNRSYLRRFSDREFAHFVSIPFSGSGHCVKTVRPSEYHTGQSARHQVWGQTRCLNRNSTNRCPVERWTLTVISKTARPVNQLGTHNVQRSTLNFQRGDRKGARWAEYGDRHEIRTTGLLTRRTYPSAGRTVQAGCGAQIWGQTRCPVYRSGTFNVQRATLKFQQGDRKGAWWPGYGDRHELRRQVSLGCSWRCGGVAICSVSIFEVV
jgi:hypothetical protein